MLPDDYEGVAQDVVASNLWANNILMSIKASDYWAVGNEFKPLMHTWYLGIIVQFYVVFSIILIAAKRLIRSKKDITIHIVGICFLISLVLYLLPNYGMTAKFYYLPFRVFEFCAGCWVALWFKEHPLKAIGNKVLALTIASYLGLFALLFVNNEALPSNVKLLLTVFITCILLVSLPNTGEKLSAILSNKWVATIGKCSFSIYIWHQIVFAFCRYSFTTDFNAAVFTLLLVIIVLLSVLSYKYIEQGVSKAISEPKKKKYVTIGTLAGSAICLGFSMWLYFNAGVIRDVPELDIYKGKAFRGMHIAYCDEVFKMDEDFTDSTKLHWLVLGTSYGRDFTNILRESEISDDVELSYIYTTKVPLSDRKKRLLDADKIFITITENAVANSAYSLMQSVESKFTYCCDSLGISSDKIMIVGSKIFASCGQAYAHRHRSDYYSMTMPIDVRYIEHNDSLRNIYGEKFIDLLSPVIVSENRVRVFSDDKKIISQDSEHLVKGGAKYYAHLLNPLIKAQIEWCKTHINKTDYTNK